MLKTSAGILILCGQKALLAHSTNSPWWRSYTPPKGGLEKGETFEQAASREVLEEVGILVDPNLLSEKVIVEYRDRSNSLYKVVHMFVHRIRNYTEIGLTGDHVPFSQLQVAEIDEAKFMNEEEVIKKVLPRYLDYIKPLMI